MSAVGSVLVLTHPFDPTADKVVGELNQRGIPVFRCDAADFPEKLSAGAELLGGHWSGQLWTLRRRLELDDVTGIYYRRPTTFAFHPDLSDDERRWAGIQARLGFGGLLASLDRWLNHPHHIGYAEYKPVQLRRAVACGFRVPRTLVTNDPETAQKFVTDVGHAVYKPFGGAGVSDDSGFRHVFTTKVSFAYGAFDFAIDQSDNWWFFEVNPGGVYGWLEYHTGVPITAALVDLLAGGAR